MKSNQQSTPIGSTNMKASTGGGFFKALSSRWITIPVAILLAILVTVVMLSFMGQKPLLVYEKLFTGAFGQCREGKDCGLTVLKNLAEIFQAFVPLMLAASGLMFTFTTGLWNIGMEGQITMGAIFSYGVIRACMNAGIAPAITLILAVLAGAVGGAFWGLMVGLLKVFGNVNEIFGGVGLNFIADAILLYLVYSPWRPAATASGSTDMLPKEYWFPQVHIGGSDAYFSWWTFTLALLGVAVAFLVLKGTYFGLKLKAVGKNKRSAGVLGIPTLRYMLSAFVICGIFAGLAGATQVAGFHHVLKNSIASGYGYLGLIVGMLSNYNPLVAVPIVIFFIALKKGSNSLNIDLQLDSNLAGVIQGLLVLFVLAMEGVRNLASRKVKEG